MRRAKVLKQSGEWVVRLRSSGRQFDPLGGGEFRFERWADALVWAIRMVGR